MSRPGAIANRVISYLEEAINILKLKGRSGMQVERAPWHRDLLSKDQTKHYEASRLWSMKYLWLVTAAVLHQQHQEHHEHPKTEDPDGTVKRRDVLDCSSPTNKVPYQGSVNLNTINIHWEIHPLRTLRSFGPRGAKSPPSGNISGLGGRIFRYIPPLVSVRTQSPS